MHRKYFTAPSPATATSGFTLIELSIVLVIIGLIVGSVMVGRDLIENSKIRGQVSQLQAFSVAVRTFKIKYNILPGDAWGTLLGCQVAGGCDTSAPGSAANGYISDYNGYVPIQQTYTKPRAVFPQLVATNLLSVQYWDTLNYYPSLSINNNFGITVSSMTDGSVWFYLGLTGRAAANAGGVSITPLSPNAGWGGQPWGVISPYQASVIDQKIDDGIPSTGTILAVISTYGSNLDKFPSQCVTDNTGTAYNVTNQNNWCRLYAKAQ